MARAAASVRSYVWRRYSASLRPADEMPRQKKQASLRANDGQHGPHARIVDALEQRA
jgi:hypothetical protein